MYAIRSYYGRVFLRLISNPKYRYSLPITHDGHSHLPGQGYMTSWQHNLFFQIQEIVMDIRLAHADAIGPDPGFVQIMMPCIASYRVV